PLTEKVRVGKTTHLGQQCLHIGDIKGDSVDRDRLPGLRVERGSDAPSVAVAPPPFDSWHPTPVELELPCLRLGRPPASGVVLTSRASPVTRRGDALGHVGPPVT